MNTIKQLRWFVMVIGIFLMSRAFLHTLNHGYDLTFDIRLLQAVVAICSAYLINAVEQILKCLPSSAETEVTPPDVSIPRFQSLDLAPEPKNTRYTIIFIEDDASLYVSSGNDWLKT